MADHVKEFEWKLGYQNWIDRKKNHVNVEGWNQLQKGFLWLPQALCGMCVLIQKYIDHTHNNTNNGENETQNDNKAWYGAKIIHSIEYNK